MNKKLLLISLIASFAITVSPLFAEKKTKVFVQIGVGTHFVDSVSFSPDGKLIASGSRDNTIDLWDVETGKEIRRLKGHGGSVYSVVFSPDGRLIASGSYDGTIKLWDVETGKEIRTLKGHSFLVFFKGVVHSVSFSPDGKLIASGGSDDTIKLWDVETGKEIRTLKGHGGSVESVAFSSDGKLIASGSRDNTIKLWDVKTGKEIRTLEGHKFWVNSVSFSPDGRLLASGSADKTIKLWDVETGKEIRTLEGHKFWVRAVVFSPDGRLIASGDWSGTIKLWDVETGKEIRTLEGVYSFARSIAFSPNGRFIAYGNFHKITLWDAQTYKEIAEFVGYTDGEWVVITPEGYYNASPNGEKHLEIRIGNNLYTIENYREALYRPDLVKLALSGSSLKDYKTLADIKQPPIVEIIDTPASTDKDEVKVTVKLTDQGGGIGDVRLYLNETAVLVDSARGLKIVAKPDEKTIYKTYTIKLLNGENTIKAVAFNGDNTMQSNPAYHKVMASLKLKKPSLYAIVIGINEYKNPKLELKYAVADAKLFADTLKSIASPLFEKVEINLLTTKEQTTKEAIKSILGNMKKLSPEDVFVFYVASHGTVDEGEYFLITSNVGSLSTFRLKEDALTQTELKELIANVPSTKKFIVIDTCNAGKLGEALQVAMLTRGMSEETAMKILSKAVGSTILSASTSLQEALEGYQGHGLFTYVLTEGMKGKADTDRDGFIRTLELANYVDSEVPALAEKVFKRAQYPTATPSGQSFPIGKVK